MLSGEGMVPAVSVLICTRDRRDMLDALLADLKGQDYGGVVEIVVVEETDDPRPLQGVRYVPLPGQNRGIAYARNRAIDLASQDLVVFVDDDCRVAPNWLQRLLAPFADAAVLGVQGGVTVPDGTNAIGWAESLLGFPGGGISRVHHAHGQDQDTLEVSTLNAAYRRSAVLQAGGFPEPARLGGEDYLLAKRVATHGHLLFVPEAVVKHAARGSLPAIWRWFVRRGRAEIELIRAGIAPQGYGQYLVRASFSLKLAVALATVLWLGWWLPLLLLLGTAAMTCWRLRWALTDREIPTAAYAVAPLVRLVMDLANDVGRLRTMLTDRE
jgi:GT2 family glycosyltransferase